MVRLNVDQMSRYVSPVNPTAFPTLSIILLGNRQNSIERKFIEYLFCYFRDWNFFNGLVFCL
jgi:hypothetical protein